MIFDDLECDKYKIIDRLGFLTKLNRTEKKGFENVTHVALVLIVFSSVCRDSLFAFLLLFSAKLIAK